MVVDLYLPLWRPTITINVDLILQTEIFVKLGILWEDIQKVDTQEMQAPFCKLNCIVKLETEIYNGVNFFKNFSGGGEKKKKKKEG